MALSRVSMSEGSPAPVKVVTDSNSSARSSLVELVRLGGG